MFLSISFRDDVKGLFDFIITLPLGNLQVPTDVYQDPNCIFSWPKALLTVSLYLDMPLVRPRLTDHFGIALRQEEIDFAIPFLDEDIPLYVDPFLLWKSPSQQDNALHTAITNSSTSWDDLL